MARGESPLSGDDEPLSRFAADLRELRQRAGSPTYREMVKRVHYSLATLSGAASGRKLPSLAVTLAYVKACGGDTGPWERRWHAVAAELAADDRPDSESDAQAKPPYVGLAPFQREDAALFFGRERLIDDLAARLGAGRFVVLFGASGAGKSSLLRAGLLARWPHQAVVFTPGAHPMEECAVQFAHLTRSTPGAVREELDTDPRGLHLLARQVTMDPPGELLVVVDQFEEIFTLCRDQAERTRFVEALVTAANAENSRCRVVLGVRSDFHAHCAGHPALRGQLASRLTVGPMTTDELRRAISGPASSTGCTVEGALLADLVAHAHDRVGVLPLLSHALLETWRRRRGNTLTLTAFQAAGGIDGALAHTAETVYTSFDPGRQELAKSLFQRLTALGEGTEDTKRRVSRVELDDADPDTAVVVDRLAAHRLLTIDGTSVEITHEALIRCWPRLHAWLTEDREALRSHRRLTEAAHAWQALDHDDSALYRGLRLAMIRRTTGRLSRLEQEFLAASEAAEAAERDAARRGTRRLRRLVALLTVLLVLTVTAGGIAVRAQRQAAEERNTATSQRVAERASALRVTNPALSAQLSLAAYRLSPNDIARGSLLSTFGTPYATRLTGHDDSVNAVAASPDGLLLATASSDRTIRLTEVTDPHHPRQAGTLPATAHAVAFSPDGRTLAAGGDGAVLRWDVAGLNPLPGLTGGPGAVTSVAFSPDSRTLAASTDHTVRLWDLRTGTSTTLTGHTGTVTSVAFSPDGRTLASAGTDHTLRLWDSTTGGSTVLAGHTDEVTAVAFGPAVLASAGADHTVRLWDLTGTPLSVAQGHTDAVRTVAFDGGTLVSGGVDASVRVWNVDDPRQPRELTSLAGHTGAVTSSAFTGGTLATAGSDHTTRLWDLRGHTLTGHLSSVYGVAFSPDGRTLATSSYDRTIRLWNPADHTARVLTGHTGPVNAVAFGPDGHLLASASADGTARLWNLADHTSSTITDHRDGVESVAFSGQTLATAGSDGTAALWDVTDPVNPTRRTTLTGHTAPVNDVTMTDRAVATAGADHTIRLWDTDGRGLAVITDHTDAVKSVAFSPDGRLLAGAGSDRIATLWDVTDLTRPIRLATFTGYTDAVKCVAFSPDGRTLATASADKTAVLWDVPTRTRLATLTGHTKPVDAVAYAPDGRTLATAGEDWSAKLWDTDPERVATWVRDTASPPITEDEWAQHFPGTPLDPVLHESASE
ncbi:nSTAND1 domain-containing NTPase [Saccharothrix luteola]|uniref:nSTAND1 domain-containing NTPase n=1 Tax=Saccharothrix luteola TaxID=2893018 RepID=UPI0027E2A67D|nr:hypothetical protein [Saccharothrix luteola]